VPCGVTRANSRLLVLPCHGAAKIGKKFLYYAESHIARHGDAEADGAGARGTLTWGKPSPGQECPCRHSAHLGDGKVEASIIVARQNAARERISRARPEAFPAGVEVAVVLMQGTSQPIRHRALDGVLPQDVGKPLSIASRPLLPLGGFVVRLIDSGRKPDLREANGVHHGLEIKAVTFMLGHRPKFLRLLRAGHVEEVKEGVNHAGARLLWVGIRLLLRHKQRSPQGQQDHENARKSHRQKMVTRLRLAANLSGRRSAGEPSRMPVFLESAICRWYEAEKC